MLLIDFLIQVRKRLDCFIKVVSMHLNFDPVWSGVSDSPVDSWPGQHALSRLLSDVYLSEAEVYLGGVFLTSAAHLPRLSKSQCLVSGNPPTEGLTVDHQLLIEDGKGERGVMGRTWGKWERVNWKIGQGWGHEAAGELKTRRIRSEGTEEIRLRNILERWCCLMDVTRLSWVRLRDRTLRTIL